MSQARTVILVVIIGLISLIGIAVIGTIGGVVMDTGASTGEELLEDPPTDEEITLDSSIDEEPDDLTIAPTPENAIVLDGDGYVDGVAEAAWFDGSWSVCAAGELDGNEQATYNLFAYDNETILLEYADGEWRAHHYVGEDSASAAVPSSADTEFGAVCAVWDDELDELTLDSEHGTDTAGLTAENPDRRVANNWVGTVDEIRIVNGTASSSDVSTYVEDPVGHFETEQAARMMFNEGEGQTTHVYYADDEAALVGTAAWGSGVTAPEMTRGEDYAIGVDPLRVLIHEDGYLAGGPVVYTNWATVHGTMVDSIVHGTANSLELIPIVMLVLLASLVVAIVQRMR